MKRWRDRHWLLLVTSLVLAGLAIYGTLIWHDPFLHRDDIPDVSSFESFRNLGDYLRARTSGVVLDLVPVRDLSFFADAFIKRATSLSPFHFTNFALWMGCAALTFALIRTLTSNATLALALALLAALHPVTATSVAWISARKHLLATLFALGATLLALSALRSKRPGRRQLAGIAALYALSVLSQPLLLAWPLWLALFAWSEGRLRSPGIRAMIGACVAIMLIVAGANFYYYTGPYVTATGHPKLYASGGFAPEVPLFAIGRYVFNLLLPFRVLEVYYTGATANLVGLLLFPVVLFAGWRLLGRRNAHWLFLAFLAPLFMSVSRTNIFVSDTYALSSVFFLAAAAAVPLARLRIRPSSAAALGALALALSTQSWAVARSHQSELALYERAYQAEPSPEALLHHIDLVLIPGGRLDEAELQARRLREWSPNDPLANFLLAKSIYKNSRLPARERIQRLEGLKDQDHWVKYYQGRLYAQEGQLAKAYELETQALSTGSDFLGDRPLVERQVRADCAKLPGCAERR